jgi:hypothetical protein
MVGVDFPQAHSLYVPNGGSKCDKMNGNHSGLKNTYTWNSIHYHFHCYAEQYISWQLFHAP